MRDWELQLFAMWRLVFGRRWKQPDNPAFMSASDFYDGKANYTPWP